MVQLRYFSYEEKDWCHSVVFVLFQDLVMDILRVLSTPDLEVRKKTLQLALDLVSSRNVEEVKRALVTLCGSGSTYVILTRFCFPPSWLLS